MNIFTRFLTQKQPLNPSLEQFIAHWDQLEALVIRVYKNKQATAADQTLYAELRPWLQTHYPSLTAALQPFWQASKVGGKLEHGDPFVFLFTPAGAEQFINNWAAMQHLPAARETLNSYLVAHSPQP